MSLVLNQNEDLKKTKELSECVDLKCIINESISEHLFSQLDSQEGSS